MLDDNKKNLIFFEGSSMRQLYDNMEKWQTENKKRLLSMNIQKENDNYFCIALTNPSEVVIVAKTHIGSEGYQEIKGYMNALKVETR